MTWPSSDPARLSRREVLSAAAVLPLVRPFQSGDEPRGQSPRGPNLLILLADDGGRAIGPYGDEVVPTPHLSALAAGGVTFTDAYTPVAVNMPARAALYSGLYPTRSGALGPESVYAFVRLWGDEMASAGYFTGFAGKLNFKPRKRFEEGFGFFKRATPKTDEGRTNTFFASAFRAFLEQRGDEPFSFVASFRDPGTPFRKGAPETDPATVRVPETLPDDESVRRELARFYDGVTGLDGAVGAVLAVLDEADLARDTLVLFVGTGGLPFPFARNTLYEAGVRVPLIARGPRVMGTGRRSDALVSLIDLLPTGLDLVGGKVPTDLDGMSLLPLLTGARETGREAVFAMHTEHAGGPKTPSRSVRIGKMKYILSPRTEVPFDSEDLRDSPIGKALAQHAEKDPAWKARLDGLRHRPRHELFDLAADPGERSNLALDPARASEVRDLYSRVSDFMKRHGDPWKSAPFEG